MSDGPMDIRINPHGVEVGDLVRQLATDDYYAAPGETFDALRFEHDGHVIVCRSVLSGTEHWLRTRCMAKAAPPCPRSLDGVHQWLADDDGAGKVLPSYCALCFASEDGDQEPQP